MKVPKQDRQTNQIKVVETYNLYRSLERLKEGNLSSIRLRRALYHALGMASIPGLEEFRIALRLP